MTEEELVTKWENLTRNLAADDDIKRLAALARVGLAAGEMRRALSIIADGDGDPHEIALQTLSALPKPGEA